MPEKLRAWWKKVLDYHRAGPLAPYGDAAAAATETATEKVTETVTTYRQRFSRFYRKNWQWLWSVLVPLSVGLAQLLLRK